MKIGDKYSCKYRGTVTVTKIVDNNIFEVSDGKRFFPQSINDIGKILVLASNQNESKVSINTSYFKYNYNEQSQLVSKLSESNDPLIINREVDQLYGVHKGLDFEGVRLNDKAKKIKKYNLDTKVPNRTKDDFENFHVAKNDLLSINSELKKLLKIHKEPYFARIDLEYPDKHVVECYIGKIGYDAGNVFIYDWRDEVNKMYYLSSQREFITPLGLAKVAGRFEYSVNNCILYDFQNKTKEVRTLDSGTKRETEMIISDKFLIDILNDKRRSPQLIDIIPTIQENQYRIISQPPNLSFIVQGCAGSGKTMVLLHRLSYLLYNKLVSKESVVILSPNNQFISFINSLMNDLEIGSVQTDTFSKFISTIAHNHYGLDTKNITPLKCNLSYSEMLGLLNKLDKFIKLEVEKFINARIDDDTMHIINKYTKTHINPKDFSSSNKFYISCRNSVQNILDIDLKNKEDLIEIANRLIVEMNKQILSGQNKIDSLRERIKLKEMELINIEKSITENNDNKEDKKINRVFQKVLSIFKSSSYNQDEQEKISDISKLLYEELKDLDLNLQIQISKLKEKREFNNKINSYKDILEQRSFSENEIKIIIDDLEMDNKKLLISKFILTKSERTLLENKKEYLNEDLIGSVVIQKFMNQKSLEKDESNNLSTYLTIIFEALYRGPVSNYRAYYIDEAQDYSPIEIFLLKSISSSQNPAFNLFGDINQRLDVEQTNSWDDIKTIINGEYFLLNANYRNTYEITSFYNGVLGKTDMPVGIYGEEVKKFHAISDAIHAVINCEYNRKVVILNSLDLFRESEVATRYKSLFNYVVERTDEYDYNKVNITTVDKVKGMEFDLALVVLDGMSVNSKYVAMTRAIHQLIVINSVENRNSVFFRTREDNCDEIEQLFDYYKYWSDKENKIRNNKFDDKSSLILDIKNNKESAIEFFFDLLNKELKENIVISVVPSHDPLKLDSGVRTLAKKLAASRRIDGSDALVRIYKIEKQSNGGHRSKEVHLRSIKPFNINKIKNKNIFLLDDVTTTGNSLEACKEILIRSGAKEVKCFALSKTKKEF